MHIAICDDNVADRKQLERLLKREAENRTRQIEGLYVDSYGHLQALLRSPMLYDVFFIDMCHGETTGVEAAHALTEVGVNAPIVLCSSLIPYQEYTFPENVLFLEKPIKKEELSASIDHAIKVKESAVPHIELREESGEYHYVTEPDILYAVAEGRYIKITLANQKVLRILSTLENLSSQLTNYPSIFPLNRRTLVNGRHLQNIHFLTATMSDGTAFRIAPGSLDYARYAREEFRA